MRESIYQELLLLNESSEKQIYLVRHQLSNVLFIKKIIPYVNHIEIYEQLLKHPHPNMANVMEYSNDEDHCVLIEEFVNGTTLEYELSARSFTLRERQAIFMELFDVLEHIHHLRPAIVHRDIKPANIMLEKGHVKLIDFDIARHIDTVKSKDTQIIGSVGYAAPEQYGFAQSDQRSDVYAIGVLMKELLMEGEYVGIYEKLVQRCLEMDPSHRYQSIQELRKAFVKHNVETYPVTNKTTTSLPSIPGFAGEKGWQRILIYLFYAFVVVMVVTSKSTENSSTIALILEKISIAIVLLLILWVPYNVGNILEMLPLYQSKYKIVRILNGVIVWLLSSFLVLFIFGLLFATLKQIP